MSPFRESHLLKLLDQYDHNNAPLDLMVSQYFRQHKSIGSKDRKAIAEVLYQMVRHRSLIDFHTHGEKNWKNRYNTYSNFNLEESFSNPNIDDHIKVSFPKNLFDKLQRDYGKEKALKIGKLSNLRAPITIRVNPLKVSLDQFIESMEDEHPLEKCSHSPYGLRFLERFSLFQTDEFKNGYFEMQDEASQLVANLIDAKPKQKVLDYCSGSGGKALAIAPQMERSGVLYLHDIRPGILRQAKKRLKRAGVQNSQILEPQAKKNKKLYSKMDWVLIDVPCSGSGTYKRNPDLKWRFSEEMLEDLTYVQREIFEKALKYLKPDGKLVYSTCSLLTDENENQVNYFLKNFPVTLDKTFKSVDQMDQMDAFFGAIFSLKP